MCAASSLGSLRSRYAAICAACSFLILSLFSHPRGAKPLMRTSDGDHPPGAVAVLPVELPVEVLPVGAALRLPAADPRQPGDVDGARRSSSPACSRFSKSLRRDSFSANVLS